VNTFAEAGHVKGACVNKKTWYVGLGRQISGRRVRLASGNSGGSRDCYGDVDSRVKLAC
jgi:hypothetical protein